MKEKENKKKNTIKQEVFFCNVNQKWAVQLECKYASILVT